jgi:hypothetical protein
MRVVRPQRIRHSWRWTAALGSLAALGAGLLMWLAVLPVVRVHAAATVTTFASATMSADTAGTAPGSGAYTTLTGPVLQEGAAGDIVDGGVGLRSIELHLPVLFFEYDPTATVVVSVSPSDATGTKIDNDPNCGSPAASEQALVNTGSITIFVCSTSTAASTLTWSGIKVRPITGGPFDVGACGAPTFPTGTIANFGTATIVGAPPSYGVLSETNGNATTIAWAASLPPNGTVNTILVAPGTVCLEDQFGNPAVGAPMSWSVSSAPAGATCQELIAPQATTNDTGRASTQLRLGHLDGNYQVSASSGAVGPVNSVSSATNGPGAPCVVPTDTPTSTPTAGTPTVTPTSTNTPGPSPTGTKGPMETVALVAGCRIVTSTEDLDTATLRTRFSPPYRSVWLQVASTGIWLADSPAAGAPMEGPNDLANVKDKDGFFACMPAGGGTFTRAS